MTKASTKWKKGTLWQKSKEKICGICGGDITFEEATVDHIIPFGMNGSNKILNMQLAHSECNQQKKADMPEVFDCADLLYDECGRVYLNPSS